MALSIDRTTWNKAASYGVGHGYQPRPAVPQAILVHATHGKRGSAFAAEAEYLFTSPRVSAHFLVGKAGQVVQFLEPRLWAAWHSGDCSPNIYENLTSVGIELHAATTEAITNAQQTACTQLVRHLLWQYQIAPQHVARHGTVAVPAGRKSDPATWPEPQFARWRAALAPQPATFTAPASASPASPLPDPSAPLPGSPPPSYRGRWRLTSGAWVRDAPYTQGPKAGRHMTTLKAGAEIAGELRIGETYRGREDWIAFWKDGKELFVWSGSTVRIG